MKHIIIGGIFMILLVAGMIGYKFMDDADLTASSDSGNIRATVNIGVDSWAVGQVDFLVGHVEVAAENDGFAFLQYF